MATKDDVDVLHDLVKKQWNIDSLEIRIPAKISLSKQDVRAEEILNRTMKRIGDEFETGLLWKSCVSLPESKINAFTRLKCVERKMDRDPERYPDATEAIKKLHYMDDYLDCANSETEALKQINDVIAVHKRAHFNICNWICNSKDVLKQINRHLVAHTEKNLDVDGEIPIERILGLWWDPKEDCFTFLTKFQKINSQVMEGKRLPTKREVLRTVMSIYDPLGYITNFTIQGKILLQDIWRSGSSWDDEITSSLEQKWFTCF
ncbi:hypothetical protein NQ315_014866 [Exocentrus adspersus]|uniref:Uncharacterized protein n=1 Tax=Exocentrus adspersus TaxID=1586481 RepID=A0AAV8VKS2_9CUCU|nr:hypothetical protein NQ315_014866 [Exocentrus adspersus]